MMTQFFFRVNYDRWTEDREGERKHAKLFIEIQWKWCKVECKSNRERYVEKCKKEIHVTHGETRASGSRRRRRRRREW